jgi:hypothetical protein
MIERGIALNSGMVKKYRSAYSSREKLGERAGFPPLSTEKNEACISRMGAIEAADAHGIFSHGFNTSA